MAEDYEVAGLLPGETSNRTFVMAAVGMGSLLVLSMICLAVYALVLAPRQQTARETQAANISLQNTEVAATQTAEAAQVSPSPTSTATETPEPTPTVTATLVVVLPTETSTPFLTLPTLEPMTATAAAQLTLEAELGGPTPTALPATGFADEGGMPLLLLFGSVLLVVIVVARGLRSRTALG
jgi:type II secretory pathway pseudopilin PulG